LKDAIGTGTRTSSGPYDPLMPKQPTSETDELLALQRRASDLEAELEGLRRAHEAQTRHLVAERLALANEIEQEVTLLREEVAWRREVMEVQEWQLKMLRNSRSLRYTEPLRRLASALRRT
jgi:hypothetical protein